MAVLPPASLRHERRRGQPPRLRRALGPASRSPSTGWAMTPKNLSCGCRTVPDRCGRKRGAVVISPSSRGWHGAAHDRTQSLRLDDRRAVLRGLVRDAILARRPRPGYAAVGAGARLDALLRID